MLYRDPNQTLAKYRALVRRLDHNRREFDPESFAQLMRILRRRIGGWAMELRRPAAADPARRAA